MQMIPGSYAFSYTNGDAEASSYRFVGIDGDQGFPLPTHVQVRVTSPITIVRLYVVFRQFVRDHEGSASIYFNVNGVRRDEFVVSTTTTETPGADFVTQANVPKEAVGSL